MTTKPKPQKKYLSHEYMTIAVIGQQLEIGTQELYPLLKQAGIAPIKTMYGEMYAAYDKREAEQFISLQKSKDKRIEIVSWCPQSESPCLHGCHVGEPCYLQTEEKR